MCGRSAPGVIAICLGFVMFCLIYQVLFQPMAQPNIRGAETKCVVEEKQVVGKSCKITVSFSDKDGSPHREVAKESSRNYFQHDQSARRLCDEYQEGSVYTCYYDTENPTHVYLHLGWDYTSVLLLLLPFLLIVPGITYLCRRTKRKQQAQPSHQQHQQQQQQHHLKHAPSVTFIAANQQGPSQPNPSPHQQPPTSSLANPNRTADRPQKNVHYAKLVDEDERPPRTTGGAV